MPRPEIDPEVLTGYEESADQGVSDGDDKTYDLLLATLDRVAGDDADEVRALLQKYSYTPERKREVYISGCWLHDQLLKVGCPPELADRICFANGQLCYGKDDMWEVAKQSLENYRRGVWEEPGPELGQRIAEATIGPAMQRVLARRRGRELYQKYARFHNNEE